MTTDENDGLMLRMSNQLTDQGKAIEQILWQIKGNDYPEVEGIIPCQRRIEQQITDLREDVSNALAWVVGALGTVGGLFSVYFQIFGHG
jgi:hypothetical protein